MSSSVLGFQNIDKTKLMDVGGKGANLGELCKIDGIHVPAGFCISTDAYKRITEQAPSFGAWLDQLSQLSAEDQDGIRELSAKIRNAIEMVAIPADIEDAVSRHLAELGEHGAYAVRSSATAEDLPTASFAGQQDSYLNVVGKAAILAHISKCWASLFTERAITYRLQNGFDHRKVYLSVVVQQMVFPQAAGILFTADPVSSNRKVLSIDAGFGIGEALASGLVNPDVYKVRDGKVIDKKVPAKKMAIQARDGGGTEKLGIEPAMQNREVLTNEQILQLEGIGRKIEAHFGCPQDVEWCLVGDAFFIVQSRPITTLYPVPVVKDQDVHVYISVGHQQMMTAPLRPLGLSLFQLTAARPMFDAGGRLFVDVTSHLASPGSRAMLLDAMGRHDPLLKDALMTIIERDDIVKPVPGATNEQSPRAGNHDPSSPAGQPRIEFDAATVSALIEASQESIEALKQNIRAKSGADLFDFVLEDIQELKKALFNPQSSGVIMAGMAASTWLNDQMEAWLGERSVADTLSQSAPHNVTSEMGLALLDVADAIRPYPDVIAYLQRLKDDDTLDRLVAFNGGRQAKAAIDGFLKIYGVRCGGEIDITRPRWSEKPSTIVPMILANIKNFEPGASKRKFEQGRREAEMKEQDLLARLEQLPDGTPKAEQTRAMISRMRELIGYREYPKYGIVSRYFIYKQALLDEAEKLVRANLLQEKEDIYYLTFEEFRDVVRTKELEQQIISRRKAEYRFYERLTPPRVITSDGEIVVGKYKREDVPADALVGLAVSSGVIEGRARVILKLEDAALDEGDILVTSFTDPSWTPLFVSIKGLVTEVGGLMTHGAVIAREYGLPAIVGVESATTRIKDGQRIRVHGTDGYVELL